MNVGRFLADAAERDPAKAAFVWGSNVVSYGDANARSDSVAGALQRFGLAKGERVGVLMPNCPELLESMFATWKAGGCVVPLNARFRREEIIYHLADARARAVIFGEEYRDVVAALSDQVPAVERFICVGEPLAGQLAYEELAAGDLGPHRDGDVADEDLAWLFYTSGTTGRPKGAMLTYGNLTFVSVAWVADLMPLQPEDVGIHAAPLTHGAGFHALALTMKGATQVLLRPHQFDPENFCATVQRHRITNAWLVPTQIKMLLNYAELGKWDLSSLRWIVYGGSPMYVEDLKEALRRIGPVFVQIYGQGETPMTATYLRPEDHVAEGALAARLASCGRVRSGLEVRVLDEQDRELRRGQTGQICVNGASVMAGYWERPEATAETLRDGWLHTGDIGYMDSHGYVFILDRTKDMIISGGANIYPRELEEVLVQHPAVSEACVVGVPHDVWGEAVKAVVVLQPGAVATGEALIRFVGERLADYKKPKSVDFVAELPKNAYGKVLRRELKGRYWEQDARMAR
jgi:acyl-CoA synthetase (AMP-forming)/AMP-acid ligase II